MLYTYLFGFFSALFISAILVPVIRHVAIRHGKVAEVRHDRWHKRPTAVLGGIGIWFPFILVTLFLTHAARIWDLPLLRPPVISNKILYAGLGGASGMFILGLIDDVLKLNPQIKLIAQIIIATVTVKSGIVIEIIPYPVIAIPLTIFWIVGITNAFNLLDNMDGLSAGIAGIVSLLLFAFSIQNGNLLMAILSIPLAGAAFGFLGYNFYPAKIFMGDCGSLFLGCMIAILAIIGTWREAANILLTLAPPLLVLCVPLFDTAFVTVTRRLRGRAVSQGGRDHISHRLVMLGLSERRTVLILYSASVLFGSVALYLNNVGTLAILIISILVAFGLFLCGMFFGEFEWEKRGNRDDITGDESFGRKSGYYPFSKRRITEILMDITLISAAYFSSYLIRTEGMISEPFLNKLIESLPWIIILKSSIFYYMGLYRSHWRYISIPDLINIVKAVTVSSLVIVVVFFMFTRFSYGYSRAVFIIDWMLTLILIGGSRCAFRVFRELVIRYRIGGKNTLIVGAGDAGELILKEIKNNHLLDLKVVGFIDDDFRKQGMMIHNINVLGTTRDMPLIARKNRVQEVLIAIPSASREVITRIENICKENGLKYGVIPTTKNILDGLVQVDNQAG